MQEAQNNITSKQGWIKGKGKAHRFRDHAGEIHGKLTIKSFVRMHPRNGGIWLGECTCGNTREVIGGALKNGTIKSCKSCTVMKVPIHGEARDRNQTPEYKAFMSMKSRCHNSSAGNFYNYGGKGIRVCDEWRAVGGFQLFLACIGRRPSSDHSVDRWPNRSGNYEPGNVRWATSEEQSGNRDCNLFVTFQDETLCASQMARKFGINPSTFLQRIKRGYSVEEAILKPIQTKTKQHV